MEVSRKNSEILRENLARILEFTNDKKKEGIILEETNIIIIYSTLEQIFGQEFWRRAKRLTKGKILEGTSFRFKLEMISKNSNVFTDRGKGRLLVKHLLDAHLLSKVVQAFRCLAIYPPDTYLGCQELEDEISCVMEGVDSAFLGNLNLDRNNWLDISWHLPQEQVYEFVPASDLGVWVVLAQGRAVVTWVTEASVAAEDGKVEVGDVITHINRVSLIGEKSTDKMLSLISKGKRKPISMTVTKCFNVTTERLYPPIVPLLKSVGLNVDEIYRRNFLTKRGAKQKLSQTIDTEDYNPLEDSDEEENAKVRTGHSCLYIGSVDVGHSGDFDRIEFGINRVLSVLPETCGQVAYLQLSDMELSLVPHNSEEVVLRYAYPQIASCGRLVHKPCYFGFISLPGAGSRVKLCECHVFYAPSAATVADILTSISDGFNRTHFAV